MDREGGGVWGREGGGGGWGAGGATGLDFLSLMAWFPSENQTVGSQINRDVFEGEEEGEEEEEGGGGGGRMEGGVVFDRILNMECSKLPNCPVLRRCIFTAE